MRTLPRLLMAALLIWVSCRTSPGNPSEGDGYWSASCVSGDGRYLLAGGDHAALVDASSGLVALRVPGMVKAVGCDPSGGVIVGYDAAFRLPGRAPVPVPFLGSEGLLGMSHEGAFISAGRSVVGGRWKGPATVFVDQVEGRSRVDLLPERFGLIGSTKPRPTADTFAVRFGGLLQDGRLLLAAGWQPSRNGGTVEDLPWGFFAWDLKANEATPLTGPVPSTVAVNQSWVERIAGTPDAAHLVVAAHDGERLSIARFERDSTRASGVVTLASKGEPSVLALSPDGVLVAVGSESRGREAPAQAWLLDAAGKVLWSAPFEKRVAGVHFLPDRSLLVAAGEGKAVKVMPSPPPGTAARAPSRSSK